jgi:hypothetical protein
MSLSADDIKAIKAIKKTTLTDEEIKAIKDINKNEPSALKKSYLAAKAGAEETLAGTSRIISKFGLPDWLIKINMSGINDAIQQMSSESQSEFDKTNPNLKEQAIEGLTHYGTSAIISGGGESLIYKQLAKLAKLSPAIASGLKAYIEKNMATKYAAKLAKSAPSGAAFGAVTASPDESLTQGAVIGSAANVAGIPVFDAIGGAIKAITKFNAIKQLADMTTKSILELKKSLSDLKRELTRLTPMGSEVKQKIDNSYSPQLAGNILQNPEVNKLEVNTLPTLSLFSKQAVAKIFNTAKGLYNDSSNIFSLLTNGMDKAQLSEGLQRAGVNNAAKVQKQKRLLYQKNNKIAEKEGAKVKLDNLGKSAKKLKKDFSRVYNEVGVSQNQEGIKSLRNIIKKVYKKPSVLTSGLILPDSLMKDLAKTGKDASSVSLKTANFAKSALRTKMAEAKASQEYGLESIYSQLLHAIQKDIGDTISNGSSELKSTYETAENFYKENIAPLEDKGIASVINNKMDSNVITSTFLPKSGSGRLNLLQKILKNAPGSEKLLLTDMLSFAKEENQMGDKYINPDKLLTLLNNIGDDRLKMLIKDRDTLSLVKQFKNNMGNGRQALEAMWNPKTGYAGLANNNAIATMKLMDDIANDLLKGDVKGLISKAIATASSSAKFRAINDPKLIEKIISIKEGSKVPTGVMYKAGQATSKSGQTISQLLTQIINQQ